MADWGWPEHATPGYIESTSRTARDRRRRRRDGAGADVPAADADPHPLGQRQVAQRDQQHPPALDERRPTPHGTGVDHRRPGAGHDEDRLLRRPGLGAPRASARGGRAVSHHMGRWRLHDDDGSRWATGKVDIDRSRRTAAGGCATPNGVAALRQQRPGQRAHLTGSDPGVHQNLAFPVQPDPMSGMHCWLQRSRLDQGAAGRPVRRRRGRPASRARSSTSGWR